MLRGSIIGFTRFNALTLEIRKWCYEGGRNIKYWTPLQWMLVIMIMVIPRVGERTAERWLSRIGWSQRGLKGHPSQLHSHYSSFRADTICTNRTSPLCIIFARYVTRLRMLHSWSWAAEMYGCLRNTQVLNMATSASKRKSVL